MIDDSTATICDFAPLFVLNALEGEDERLFAMHLDRGCAQCGDEIASMQFAADALSFASSPIKPPAILKERVLSAVRPTKPTIAAVSADAISFGDEGPWKPYSAPGIEYRMLHLDRAAREIVMLVRAQAGSQYPEHSHNAVEDMFMLRGELVIDGKSFGSGAFIRSTCGSRHGVADTPDGCMFLMRGSLDDLLNAGCEIGSGTEPRA